MSLPDIDWSFVALCDPYRDALDGPRVAAPGWAMASNGKAALLLHVGDTSRLGPTAATVDLRPDPGHGEPADVAWLLEQCGPEPGRQPCDRCQGTRKIICETCDGQGRHVCSACDDEHECRSCDGMGRTSCGCPDGRRDPQPVPVLVGGQGVDALLLRRYLRWAPSGPALAYVSHEQRWLVVHGEGWAVIVMMLTQADVPRPLTLTRPGPADGVGP